MRRTVHRWRSDLDLGSPQERYDQTDTQFCRRYAEDKP